MENKLSVFISYRRADSIHFSGRLNDALNNDFDVFYDTEGGIGYGEDFPTALREGIEKADIFLMVIGLKSCNEFEIRKEKSDFVIYEITHARKNNCKIIPILIDGATMPECFPNDISFVASLHAFEFKNNFLNNVNELKKEINKTPTKKYLICQERKKEIENYITYNNLNKATLRLMDFAQDFAHNRKRKNDSKDIRAKFNTFSLEEKQFGISEKITAQYSELHYEIFNLIEEIEIEFQEKKNNKNNKNKIIGLVAILISIVVTFFLTQEEIYIKQEEYDIKHKISLIKLDKDISKKFKIQNSNYISKNDDIDIVKNQFRNNSFIFAIRNNTNYEILINKAKLNLYTTYGNCYQPTPIQYKVDFVLQKSRYEINGTIISSTELEFEWDDIIRPKEVEIYNLSMNNLYFDKATCVNGFLVNLDLIYDNKYKVSTQILRINNESH